MMDENSPFYLAINTEVPTAGKKWFKASLLGVNSLRSIVKNMVGASQVQSDKKLVNHSTRREISILSRNLWIVKFHQTKLYKSLDTRT